ncbi:hypothetical protein KR505_11875 [Eubacterium callanderi]|uniref:hypothetical protein n=1 Tax=Eubacterium callanderi TaxID=53442 RepID=UPI001C2D1AC4|nr:hypothetical protein [Eubacterium callanderi]MBV1684097.1 hypothetical protein [Eubacterium callanderi]WPK69231.1 hypothetical protein EUCA2A_34190 [Eubacterium callanderi]WPK73529.1 hypothetical protein EUCA11A_34190 [Eubacterium callanderi]
MILERKAFINSLMKHYQPNDAQNVQDMLKDLLGATLQGMLKTDYAEKYIVTTATILPGLV